MSNLSLQCQTVQSVVQRKEGIEITMVHEKEQQFVSLIRQRHLMTHNIHHTIVQQQNALIIQLVAHFRDQNLYRYVGMIVGKIQMHAEKIIFMNGDLRLLKQNLGNQIATIEYAAKYIQNFPELYQLIQILWGLFRVTTFFTAPYVVCPRMIELFNLSVVRDIYLSQFNATHQVQLNIYHQYNQVPQRYDNLYLYDDDYSTLQPQQQSSAIYSEYGYNKQQSYQNDTQYQQQRDYQNQQTSQPSYSNPYQSQTYNYNVSVNYQYNTGNSNPYSNQQSSCPPYSQQPPPVVQNFVQPPPVTQGTQPYQSNMPYPPTTNYYSGQPTYPNQGTSTPPVQNQIQQPSYPLPPPQTNPYPQSTQQPPPYPQSAQQIPQYPQSTTQTPPYSQSTTTPPYPQSTATPLYPQSTNYPQQTTQVYPQQDSCYPTSTPQTPTYPTSTPQTQNYYSDYQAPHQQTAQTTNAQQVVDQYAKNTQVTSNQQISYNYNSTETYNQNNTQITSNQQIQYNQNQYQPNQQYPYSDSNQQQLNDQQKQNLSTSGYIPQNNQQQNDNIQQTPNSSGSITQSTQFSQISQATSIYIPPNKEQQAQNMPPPPINMPPPPPPPINYAPMTPLPVQEPVAPTTNFPPPPPPPPPQPSYNLPVYPPQQTQVSQQINNIPPPSEFYNQQIEKPQEVQKDDKSLFEELVKSCLLTEKLTDSQGQPKISNENKVRKDKVINKGFKNHDEQALYILKCYIDGKYVQNKIDRTEEMKQLVKS